MIPINTETLNLNTFGNEKFSKRDCDLIKLRLQGKHGEDVNISALSFEAICSPVPSKVSLHEHPHLLYLDLADCISGNMDSQDNIDVLIGSDYYWDIITGGLLAEMTNWWQLVANLDGSCLGLQRGTVELPTSPHQI